MKKFLSILLALAMILAMSTTVFAAENETVSLTITGATGHTYALYQIFIGDVAKEGGKDVLSNVKYGEHYHPNGQKDAPVPENVLESIVNSNDPEDLLDIALKESTIIRTPGENETSVVFENLAPGYYLIKDISTTLPDGQTKSPIMLQVLESTTIASKHASIVSKKKVYDVNDSGLDPDGTGWFDAADHDIGDDVPFRLSVTIPSTYSTYQDYTLTFHDMLSTGFDAPDEAGDFTVYILKADNTKIPIPQASTDTSGFTYHAGCTKTDTCEFEGKCSFNVTVGDLNDLYGTNTFAEGDKLIVEYTAKLNSNAHIGKDSNQAYNENGMYVCHPDGHTPKDYVSVLTYELTIHKVDEDGQSLTGAGFTLYKMDAAGNFNPVAVGTDDDGKTLYELAGGGKTTFTWTGIDGGKYKLVETTVPAGYNAVADIVFTVDATHATVWEKGTNAAFFNLIAKDDNEKTVFADQDANALEDGILEGNVENHKGAVLPETGAEGTFFLITGSTLLVMVAVVFMVTRKKMSVYED